MQSSRYIKHVKFIVPHLFPYSKAAEEAETPERSGDSLD